MRYNSNVGKNMGAEGRGTQVAERGRLVGLDNFLHWIMTIRFSIVRENTNVEKEKARKNPESWTGTIDIIRNSFLNI